STARAAAGPILSESKSKLILTSKLGLSLVTAASFSRSTGASELAVLFFSDSTRRACSGVTAVWGRDTDRLRVCCSGVKALSISSANAGSSACARRALTPNVTAAASRESNDRLRLTSIWTSHLHPNWSRYATDISHTGAPVRVRLLIAHYMRRRLFCLLL